MKEELPELPPGWTWHESNGRPDVMLKWRAVGPHLGGILPLWAYGRFKHNQTPEGAAEDAWRQWERLSGVTKAEWEHLQKCKQEQETKS